jgi:iron complex outermembrane receptor protein
MEATSASPDTGQRGGCTPARSRDAHAPAGKPARACNRFFLMSLSLFHPRVAVLSLAIACAFSVHAQTATLPENRVTATRFAEPAQSLPLGVSVITAEEIRASGAATVNEAISRLLGVPGRRDLYGGGETTLDLRGFGTTADTNQVIVIDGVRVSESDIGGTRLAGIPIDAVERIEVLRGSGAVLYGEGATGGVIVITTRAGSGRQRPNGGSAYGAVGSYGLREARAGATGNAGGFTVDADVQKRREDGWRANSAYDLEAGGVTGQWSNDWLRLGARVSGDDLDARLPGALSAAQYEADPRQSVRPDDWARIRNERASVFARAEVAGWELAFDAGQRSKELRSSNSGFSYDYDVEADFQALRARNESRLGGMTHIFVVGADLHQWRRDVLGAFAATSNQRTRGFYLKDDLVLAGGTRLSAGLRTEAVRKAGGGFDTDDTQRAWELGASHPFSAAWTGYGRAGRSFRLANVDEFSFTTPGVSLAPQTSRDVEIGARYEGGATRAEVRLFHSRLENEIGFDPAGVGPFGPFGANVNFDPTRRMGVEIDARHALSASLGMRLHLAWREASFRSGPYAGNDVPLVPRGTVALRADWTPAAGHRLSGGVNWVSSQHPDYANACTMPSYTTADLRYAYRWHKAEFALGVANLFDKGYYTQAFACAGGQTTSIYPETGRAFTASVRMDF